VSHTTDNPIVVCHDAIWRALENDIEWCALVKLGNRVKYDNRDPLKATLQDADMPEVRVEPQPGQAWKITSNPRQSLRGTIPFAIIITTGDMRPSPSIYAIAWATVRALVRAGITLGDETVINNSDIQGIGMGLDADRARVGWTAVVNVTIGFNVDVPAVIGGGE